MNSHAEQKPKMTRGGRMTKWKGRAESFAPALAFGVSVIALSATGALAQTVVNSASTSEVELDFDEEFIVEDTGSIRVDDDGSGSFAVLFEDGSVDFEGSITNNGLIELTGDDSSGFAVTIDDTSLAGTIDNDGVIRTDREGSNPDAFGIYVDVDVLEDGAIQNSGEIDVHATAEDSSDQAAYAYGVYVSDDLIGVLSNDGTIIAEAEVQDDRTVAGAYAIFIGNEVFGNSASLDNSDTITATATADDGEYMFARAYGIYVDDQFSGESLNNTGDITATASVDEDYYSDAEAVAIRLGFLSDSTLISSGDIDVDATANNTSEAVAMGIVVDGNLDGATVDLSGVIDVKALDGSGSANIDGGAAYGILLGIDRNDFNNFISNSVQDSTITQDAYVNVEAEGDTADARGVALGNLDGSTFTNTGDIDAEATTLGYSDGYGAEAYAIYIQDVFDSEVTNQGDLDVQVGSSNGDYSPLFGAGIFVDSDVDGDSTLSNEGDITVTARTTESARIEVAGIYIGSDIGEPEEEEEGDTPSALVVNSGTIDVTGEYTGPDDESYSIFAAGMYVDDNIGEVGTTGTLRNTAEGEIFVEARNASGFVAGIGVGVANDLGYDDESSGAGFIENLGLVDVTVEADDGNASGIGISVDGDFWKGEITNSGELTVLSNASGVENFAFASGIYVYKQMYGGTITASGNTIDVTARSEDFADATGIHIDGGMFGGEIANTGDAFVLADGDNEAAAIGIFVDAGGSDTALGSAAVVGNSETGLLDVQAESLNGDAFAAGIGIGDPEENRFIDADGTITNAGEIDVSARTFSDEGYAQAAGINVDGYLAGDLLNTGSISVEAIGPFEAQAVGINVHEVVDGGTLTNEGDITVTVNDADEFASATGISVDFVEEGGVVENSGRIFAGQEETDGVGIEIEDMDGEFSNSGMVLAGVEGTSIEIGGGSEGTTYLLPGSVLQGAVEANDTDVVLVSGPGTSVVWDINGDDNVTLDESSGNPWFSDGEGTYASYDATGLAAMHSNISTVAGLSFGALFNNLDVGNAPAVTQGVAGGTNMGWVQIQHSDFDYDGNSGTLDHSANVTSIAAGYSMAVSDVTTLGFMLGSANGDMHANGAFAGVSSSDFSGAFVGVGVAHQIGALTLTAGLSGGKMDHDDERTVNVSSSEDVFETASSDYDSDWVGLSAGVAYDIAAGSGFRIKPSLNYQYVKQSVGSYTETGATENASVDSFSFGVSEITGEVEVGYGLGAGSEVTGALGFISRTSSGGDSVNVTLLGDTQAVNYQYEDFTAFTAGLGFNKSFENGGAMDIGADAMFGGDLSKTSFTVSANFSFKF